MKMKMKNDIFYEKGKIKFTGFLKMKKNTLKILFLRIRKNTF